MNISHHFFTTDNICEFTTREHKVTRRFCNQKPGFKCRFKDS